MAKRIGDVDIIFGAPEQPKSLPLTAKKAGYGGFCPSTTILQKGSIKRRGAMPLPCNILFERDVAVKVRDGTTLYVDIYRPVPVSGGELVKVPSIMGWSPYGKTPGRGNQTLDDFPFRMGVPLSRLSEWQKWEGPDPGYWVQYGYAVIAPDPRGVGKSGGDIYQWGTQEGRDGADVVDFIGKQAWSNQKVGLSGNSWLCISQWFIAAEKPQHLSCIAPWEGFSDTFNHFLLRGGCLSQAVVDFSTSLLVVNAGENSYENTSATAENLPNWTAYHEDKRAKLENIDIPTYMVASYVNPIHTFGTFDTYLKLKNVKQKWLRVHDTWEWPDYYSDSSTTDLHKFFDRFLKGVDNGWEYSASVRMKILDTALYYPLQGIEIETSAWPPPEAKPLKLYLDNTQQEFNEVYPPPSQSVYTASSGSLVLTHKFNKDTIIAGAIQMTLQISLTGYTDADIFVTIEKELLSGAIGRQCKVPYDSFVKSFLISHGHLLGLPTEVVHYKGPDGRVRVSRRFIDENHTAHPGMQLQRLDKSWPVSEGETVEVQPVFQPIGMSFAKGEKMRITISGKDPIVMPPVDPIKVPILQVEDVNSRGASVTVHCGTVNGKGSFIILPLLQGCQVNLS